MMFLCVVPAVRRIARHMLQRVCILSRDFDGMFQRRVCHRGMVDQFNSLW